MKVKDLLTGEFVSIEMKEIVGEQLHKFDTKEYFFRWELEKNYTVIGLFLHANSTPLGLMSFETILSDKRIHIRLISAHKTNMGKNKRYENVVNNLIVHACKEAIQLFGAEACVSLLPKTQLAPHYCEAYGFQIRGKLPSLEIVQMLTLLAKTQRFAS